ncbi:hypothetical protein [Marivirga lumbricoides]
MRKTITISLLVLFLSNVFMFTIIRFNYEVNKEIITELFCINKEKPMTMCYGKCYLKDQLQKTKEEKEKKSSQTVETFQALTSFSVFIPVERIFEEVTTNFSVYSNQYIFLNSTSVFHPPQTFRQYLSV